MNIVRFRDTQTDALRRRVTALKEKLALYKEEQELERQAQRLERELHMIGKREYFRPIVEAVGRQFGTCWAEIFLPDSTKGARLENVADGRQVCMAIIRETTDLTFEQIGILFGRRAHKTVIHACRSVRDKQVNADFKRRWNACRRELDHLFPSKVSESA